MKAKVSVSIKSESALLMHAYPMVEIKSFEKLTRSEQAEHAAYRIPNSRELYVPAISLQRAMVSGATYSKGKGRASLQKIVAACVQVSPEYLGLGTETYEIDSRPVVIPATKGRCLRHRPRLNEWAFSFEIEYDPELLTETQMRTVLDDTGSRVGLLDFRPEKKGPFGRFVCTNWERL